MYQEKKTIRAAALRAGINEKTASRYLNSRKLPSELKSEHTWKTRPCPFKNDWPEIRDLLKNNEGLQAKTIFEYLQKGNPGVYADGQLRTLQRHIKIWRAAEGPPKEVYFPQIHYPGELCQSDFSDLSNIGVTIQGNNFEHLLFHFVLTYSNWEAGTVCFSESFESLSFGLQNAVWKLGGVPKSHQTDRLSAAVNNLSDVKEFTKKYRSLMNFLRMNGKKTNPRSPHENGDIEQRHNRLKIALQQRLMLRGSKDFSDREEYESFVEDLMDELNQGRSDKFKEELKKLRELPAKRMEACTLEQARVTKFCTITAAKKIYSVNSSLVGEKIKVKIYPEHVEVWYAGKCLQEMPRIRGSKKHDINYRHIIDSLVRKPGAFRNDTHSGTGKYRSALFPTTNFRIAYDRLLLENTENKADKEYLGILYLAARISEVRVEQIIRHIADENLPFSLAIVENTLADTQQSETSIKVTVEEPDLKEFDLLLNLSGVT